MGMEECTWSEDEGGAWDTRCGHRFYLCEGTPEENKMSFCCYCGRKLEQVAYEAASTEHKPQSGHEAQKEDVLRDAMRWRKLRVQRGWPDTEAAMSGASPEDFDRLIDGL